MKTKQALEKSVERMKKLQDAISELARTLERERLEEEEKKRESEE